MTEYVCNGAGGEGGGGLPATLPPGSTETGAWAAGGEDFVAASFAIPLEAAPVESEIVPVGGPVPGKCDDGQGEAASAANPEAEPGVFCLFTGQSR